MMKERVNSIGTCTECGYFGPGPSHDCKRPKTVKESNRMPLRGVKKFWLRDENNHPVTLVVFEIVGENVLYATATKHPKDGYKELDGVRLEHVIAEGRFNKGLTRMKHTVARKYENPIFDIAFDLMRRGVKTERSHTRWAKVAEWHVTQAIGCGSVAFLSSESKDVLCEAWVENHG
jgi:hypothetical protein